jgi:cytochrome c556
MARMENTATRSDDYRAKLADAEKTSAALQKLLKQPADNAALDAAFKQVTQSCAACHKGYRNQ